jgi:hypothetical protein
MEQHLMTHDIPQHNGIAESLNWRLLEHICMLLHQSGLPKTLWGEALHHSIWLKNWSSTWALRVIMPYECLHGHKPNLGELPEWGQCIWIHNFKGNKLEVCGLLAHWIGYDKESLHAHRIYWPEKHSITVERDVKLTTNTVTVYTPPVLPSTPPVSAPTQSQPGVIAASLEMGLQDVGMLENDVSLEVIRVDKEGSERALEDVDVLLSPLTSLELTSMLSPEWLPPAVHRST